MDGVIDIERARELVANETLWPRIREFLWNFAPQIHPSWLEASNQDRLASRFMSSARVKHLVLDDLGVEPCFHDFPKDDWSRLALVDGATLVGICQWLGAIVCADSLRRITDGKTVRELKSALANVYPEVFGYTAYFRNLTAEQATDADGVAVCGLKLLFAAVRRLPDRLVARVRLKFPRELVLRFEEDGNSAAGTDDAKREVAKSALAKLLKLKFPEVLSLCCS